MTAKPRIMKKAGEVFVITVEKDGKVHEVEIEDNLPERTPAVRPEPDRDPHPECENLRGGMYPDQNQLLQQQQQQRGYSSVQLIRQQRQGSAASQEAPAPVNRAVPQNPSPLIQELPSKQIPYVTKPVALRSSSNKQSLPSLPRMKSPRGRRGR